MPDFDRIWINSTFISYYSVGFSLESIICDVTFLGLFAFTAWNTISSQFCDLFYVYYEYFRERSSRFGKNGMVNITWLL